MENQLNIEVKDSVFDPDLPKTASSRVHVRRMEDGTYYKVWLYLEGGDLPYIESVTYTLHESFENPTQTVRRTPSNPRCKLAIWTWGLFEVKATLLDKQGFTYIVKHQLTYDKNLPAEPEKYVYEEDERNVGERPTLVNYSS